MYKNKPFCLINTTGEHEIGYSTYFNLIGDEIIEEIVSSNIDFTTYSYYKLENNHLVLIDKIFDGYQNLGEDFERKVIYTKDDIILIMEYSAGGDMLDYINNESVNLLYTRFILF